MELWKLPILVLDCQTTGNTPDTGDVIEIAWHIGKASDGDSTIPKSAWVSLPEGKSLPTRIQQLTGITENQLRNARNAKEVWGEILDDLAREEPESPIHLVVHFARFELAFLRHWHHTLYPNRDLPWEVFCTHQIAKRCLPNLPTYGIRALSGYFGSVLAHDYRAPSHVVATSRIWKGLVQALEAKKIQTTKQLEQFLTAPSTAQLTKNKVREFLVHRAKVRELPDSPGIYRLLAKDGTILYIGKATSLRKRVSSYFKRTGELRLAEMMTQVADIGFELHVTALEAALAEADAIKHFDPPFNTSLKAAHRKLYYCSQDFSRFSEDQSPAFPYGPFLSPHIFAPLECILNNNTFFSVSEFFPDLINADLFQKGLKRVFPSSDLSLKVLIAEGLRKLRLQSTETDEEEKPEPSIRVWTEEEVATSITNKIVRSAQALKTCRWLWRLRECQLFFPSPSSASRFLAFSGGTLVCCVEGEIPIERAQLKSCKDAIFSVSDYDRFRVLLTEIRRELTLSDAVEVRWNNRRLRGEKLKRALA